MVAERSIMNRLEDIHYYIIDEKIKLEIELENKNDETLVEDLLYAMDKTEVPEDCEKILNKFLHSNKITAKERKKLQALFILIYGKDAYGE